ncbi:hypothetical protein SAMN06264364_11264 [Quadrisphaera granulorum]|uniref:Uncharacterized protein n=1 Tax=Quadrisphaera granulorum TaxID=317664 RepID=A0A316A9F3_9ACTN|nr:hypothetical protein [Quadrisphaera granulorum]PWJ53494.1 hypothetical protein BXY45_11264 [Quadrisphaera granulorum]SZE96836.1 hypothetical protein SAMN06264364_11264 [Quadrisphaera granulorum]
MSQPPTPAPGTPPEEPAQQHTEQPSEQQARAGGNPRRNLTGIAFVLLGFWFASSSWEADMSVWLRVVCVVLGAAVLGYGAVQLWQNRRR